MDGVLFTPTPEMEASQAELHSDGRSQLNLGDGSPQIRNHLGRAPTKTFSELELCSPLAEEVE